jgi:signal transduction histidine kinase
MLDVIPEGPTPGGQDEPLISKGRYRRILLTAVLSVSVVAIAPLLIMTGVNYLQYEQAFRTEQTRPMIRFVTNAKQTLESFLHERTAALQFAVRERTYQQLRDPATLDNILQSLKESFGEFVDLGVITDQGIQVAYAGPYELEGMNYLGSPWFQETTRRGAFVSDVFLGYRDVPHFVIATSQEVGSAGGFVLRASIDAGVLNRVARNLLVQPGGDAFFLNFEGVLQTPSRSHGGLLESASLPALPFSVQTEQIELEEPNQPARIITYAQVDRSPFTAVMVGPTRAIEGGWPALRRNLLLFLAASVVLILAVVIWGSYWMVNRYQEADLHRAAAFHKMEYTNKMAALGRLSAGVAHEINNPVSIITEKAGLLKDLLLMSDTLPPKEKLLDLIDSVLRSADRCGGITHRLLGFAKHMQVQTETIELDLLIREVLGFLEKEAAYRGIEVVFDFPPECPTTVSDRGQLQQVFLNIINNAFAAVDDGGRIEIGIRETEPEAVAVWVQDNGVGIPEDHMAQIFDPFFSTKKGTGTGLGLSITYGIVQKLGGQISVSSKVGEGTRFTVVLPRGKAQV